MVGNGCILSGDKLLSRMYYGKCEFYPYYESRKLEGTSETPRKVARHVECETENTIA